MSSAHRTIFLVVITALALAACRSKTEVNRAKGSLYDTDFAIVFSAALDATREKYAQLDDNPGSGAIKTAWHQVTYANTQDDLSNQQILAQNQGISSGASAGGVSPAANQAGMPTRLAYKRTFIRFDVSVVGGRPWRVKVVGHAAEWDPGNAVPTELHGMARPPWLDGRIEGLQVAIYRRIKAYAVPMPKQVEVVKDEPDVPKTDPATFKNVPVAAGKALAMLKDVLAMRDYVTLRLLLSEDVTWSLGGAPGADTAMAMWQADGESVEAMGRTIAGGCGPKPEGGEGAVTCPPGPPVAGAWQLEMAVQDKRYKVTSFVKAE